ncbi:MAG: PQQ-binding-like beta-propeller repeat protein [Gammaproteobacteria bacterium]|jgi:quinoprotein glucose dehydrogenase|nr:pyrroloquinoline quinone-dependent dehydrogenase [Gammaproteobacteria bacterium]MDP6094894.1 PQQ-binding-like beta-propeller repeat protein [Gammaproteobacteria bacterium]|tara:strand:- start:1595 stop:3553 length:1959 start_codon:yes stop_codon:yes gene_type:complete
MIDKKIFAQLFVVLGLLGGCSPQPDGGMQTGPVGEWRHHGGDHTSAKYADLSQIDKINFDQLEVAWRWESADYRIDEDLLYFTGDYRATPLMVGGRIYTATNHGQVVALDAATGAELWLYDPESYRLGPPNFSPIQTRGIEYWSDGEVERIFLATLGKQLVSIDVTTGLPDPEFGDNGIVDLKNDLGRREFEVRNITHGSPPIAVGNTVIIGSKIYDYTMQNRSPPGHVRAYDARTGEFKWRFNTIPQADEDFVETWENDSWRTAGNTNVWSFMAADDELGLVYLPTSTPTNDYWGGMRLGENVYAESLLCLNAETGELVWHFQTVHHGLWDYDIASAPNLIDIEVDGRQIKAVAQVSKTGFTYVFDRVTGEPVWPIEERTVPQTTVPGERTHPTQPHPTWPLPFERIGVTVDDLIDFTPELKTAALALAEEFVLGPIFTPPIVRGQNGKRSTFVVPGAGGGANFPGATMDPESQILYIPSSTRPMGMSLVEPAAGTSDWRYVIEMDRGVGPQGLPLLKPPYRRITAIDLNTGAHVWQIPFGKGPTDHPEIAHLDLGPLGSPYGDVVAEGGILVTKTLLISYLAQKDEIDEDAHGSILVAHDKASGELVAELMVEQRLHGAPMSYMHDGKQYIAVAGGGRDSDAELIVFALP